MEITKTFCLRWSQHQDHLMGAFGQLLVNKELVDVTIMCTSGQDDHQDLGTRILKPPNRTFEAHKVN
jgi:hypothetical protein